jgi:class 3 adenylate cyclase
MLIDSDSYTSSILIDDLLSHGFTDVKTVSTMLELPNALEENKPDVVIFNYHSHQSDSLILCNTIKLMVPNTSIIAIVSPGPALKTVRTWSKQTKSIDAIIEKPLSDEHFFTTLEGILKAKESSRVLENKAARLENLVPEEALSSLDTPFNNEAEIFEATVLFTDIRRSTKLITEMAPREYFELLNDQLSAQAKHINHFEGSVVKYTGDGVMAIFKGMGRSYLGLRCALELASHGREAKLPFGIGVAEGLVLAGLIGDSHQAGQRRQYDVIGATVHLASRLCSMANAGEVITTKSVNSVARLKTPTPHPIGSISIRGFDNDIDCVSFNPSQLES